MHEKAGLEREWDYAVESWKDFVRQGKDYYRDELNNPAAFSLIGNVKGRLVLDLACGEGYNTRILAGKGAKVTGIDFSEKMIELAKRKETREKLDINYRILNADNLEEFPSNHFDVVTCFMSLQDIENYEKAVSQVARVLKTGGRFVFSIPHPCFEIMTVRGKTIRATERYFRTGRYHVEWDMVRLLKPFRTTSFHRTLTDYFTALHKSKLFVSRLVEPKPTQRGLQKHRPLRQVLLRPQSIIIESVKLKMTT